MHSSLSTFGMFLLLLVLLLFLKRYRLLFPHAFSFHDRCETYMQDSRQMVPGRYLLWEQDNATAFIAPFSFAARHCAVAAAHDTRLPSSPSSLPPNSLYANATCVKEQDALERMARTDPKVRRIREVGAGEEKTTRRNERDERETHTHRFPCGVFVGAVVLIPSWHYIVLHRTLIYAMHRPIQRFWIEQNELASKYFDEQNIHVDVAGFRELALEALGLLYGPGGGMYVA